MFIIENYRKDTFSGKTLKEAQSEMFGSYIEANEDYQPLKNIELDGINLSDKKISEYNMRSAHEFYLFKIEDEEKEAQEQADEEDAQGYQQAGDEALELSGARL